ncbi:hypothetical protein KUTeg_021711 [Tegillarca granosa]|uniref:Uncharacterized protein n=1 Tax=Tegillarca granosa TaxID=220873 RepID=A0ABQ9E9I0_TEGGR|nr:hypothetical protein KUTeg_021711 [Tegillarca granosa]
MRMSRSNKVLLGVRDAHDDLAALSLRALADMIPILGRDVFDRKLHGMDDKNHKNSENGMGNILLKDLAKLRYTF